MTQSEEYSAEDIYLKKLERGLYTLQLIDYVIVDISAAGPESVKKKVLQVLNMRGGSVSQVRQIMRGSLK